MVTEGQTLLLDQSTPVLKMLLIQGGHVVFDVEAAEELVLRAEYILIVDGGSLSIGSEEAAFPGDAVIELHGNTQSIELPMYGAKVRERERERGREASKKGGGGEQMRDRDRQRESGRLSERLQEKRERERG